jgi:hypothetical protein
VQTTLDKNDKTAIQVKMKLSRLLLFHKTNPEIKQVATPISQRAAIAISIASIIGEAGW